MSDWYQIIVPSYLLTVDFETILKKHRNHIFGKTQDVENLVDYVKKIKVVDIKTESRMVFV